MQIRILASEATDVRPLQALAARHGVACTVEILGMGSEAERRQFRELKARHDWQHLPMVFVGEAFVGGEPELAARLAAEGTAGERIGVASRWLGYGGLAPFIVLGLATLAGAAPFGISPRLWLTGYAATILSFVGAVHWGLVVARPEWPAGPARLAASVVPALVAWLALILGGAGGLWLFVAGFVGWYAWERYDAWHRYPDWYRALRTALTVAVSVTLATVAAFGN